MKQTVTKSMLIDSFARAGRKDQFSYDALSAIWEYLTELELDTGHECELDVIGICCEFEESTIQQAIDYYSLDLVIDKDGDIQEQVEEWFRDRTPVVYCDSDTIVYVQF